MEVEATEGMVVDEAPAEKMIPQSKVNEIVGREKAQLAERLRRELAQKAESPPDLDSSALEEKVYNRLLEKAKELEEQEAQKERERQEAEQREQLEKVAGQYYLKMNQGKDKYSDFDEVMTDFEPSAFPQVALLAAHLDNTPDVMYELAKNPHKLVHINALAEKSPKLAQRELAKLSQSIVKNEQALDMALPNAPLSRLKSSTNVGADNGKMTVRDFKQQDWLRN